jgi:ubiquinone/menaquinone biosynthesis C-methylase UbiE
MFPRPASISQPNTSDGPTEKAAWSGIPYTIENITPEGRTATGTARRLTRSLLNGCQRRWRRERRRRAIGRAYDMALEVARVLPPGSCVLDVGCGNGYIAHHLSALLGTPAVGIDLMDCTTAPIDYRRYDGEQFPVDQERVDAVLLCYVLHHARDSSMLMKEVRRVLRDGGVVMVYEDIPGGWMDRVACWSHDIQWRQRSGRCTFRREHEWRKLFDSSGFAVLIDRPLSRWRNLTHPVSRRFFLLRPIDAREDSRAAGGNSKQ